MFLNYFIFNLKKNMKFFNFLKLFIKFLFIILNLTERKKI